MIDPISGIDMRLTGADWPFAEARRDEIAAHWAEAVSLNPTLFDGQVLGALDPHLDGGVLKAQMIATPFSAFLAWRDWGYPDKTYFNAFGSAVIAGNDGRYLYGVMGAHTSNAGAIYPCGGSLEPADVGPDGMVDVWASAARELNEETGLDVGEARVGKDVLVRSGQLMSFARVFVFDMASDDLAERIRANLETQDDRELADVAVLRSLDDLDPARSHRYAVELAKHLLSADGI